MHHGQMYKGLLFFKQMVTYLFLTGLLLSLQCRRTCVKSEPSLPLVFTSVTLSFISRLGRSLEGKEEDFNLMIWTKI